MTTSPPPSGNRLKYLDEENKVLVKEFGDIIDNEPLSEEVPVNAESVLALMQEAKQALMELDSPMELVNQVLDSGKAASQMLNSISAGMSQANATARSMLATINAAMATPGQIASSLTNTVMNTINTALRQVPASIDQIAKIPTSVQQGLVATALGNYTNQLNTTLRSANTGLNTLSAVSNFASNAARTLQTSQQNIQSLRFGNSTLTPVGVQSSRSVVAAKKLFTPAPPTQQLRPPSPVFLPPQSLVSSVVSMPSAASSIATNTLYEVATQTTFTRVTEALNTPSGQAKSQIGTSSQLLPVSSKALKHPPTPIGAIEYTDHALIFVLAGVTWYRSLYTYLYTTPSLIAPLYGTGKDHYAVLRDVQTSLQNELYKDFGIWVRSVAPDTPSKNLYIYRCYQETVTELLAEILSLTDNAVVRKVIAHLGGLSVDFPITSLLVPTDYDRLTAALVSYVQTAENNRYNLSTPEQYTKVYTELFAQIVTDAVAAHLGTGNQITKRVQAPGEIAVYCATRLMRAFLQRYSETSDAAAKERLINALNALVSVSIDEVRYLYTDPYELVLEGHLVYSKPSTRPLQELTFPFIKHYLANKAKIKDARKHLRSKDEMEIFDALTVRLDALGEHYPNELQAIVQETSEYTYTALTAQQKSLGMQLAMAIINNNLDTVDSFDLPDHSFETYSTSVDHLYFDNDTALQR